MTGAHAACDGDHSSVCWELGTGHWALGTGELDEAGRPGPRRAEWIPLPAALPLPAPAVRPAFAWGSQRAVLRSCGLPAGPRMLRCPPHSLQPLQLAAPPTPRAARTHLTAHAHRSSRPRPRPLGLSVGSSRVPGPRASAIGRRSPRQRRDQQRDGLLFPSSPSSSRKASNQANPPAPAHHIHRSNVARCGGRQTANAAGRTEGRLRHLECDSVPLPEVAFSSDAAQHPSFAAACSCCSCVCTLHLPPSCARSSWADANLSAP